MLDRHRNDAYIQCSMEGKMTMTVPMPLRLLLRVFIAIAFVTAVSAAQISCSGGSSGYGGISIQVRYTPPGHTSVRSERSPEFLKRMSLPSGAATVAVGVTGTGFAPITREFSADLNPYGAAISGVPAGSNRVINISVLDDAGAVIASGASFGIQILANKVNPVNVFITSKGVFTPLDSRPAPRAFAVTVPLSDGTYMIMGGVTDQQSSCGAGCIQLSATPQTEVYDPRTGTFTQGTSMIEPRVLFAAGALSDGTVVVAGGSDAVDVACGVTACSLFVPPGHAKSSVEIYYPSSHSFYETRPLLTPRAGLTASVLPGDTVLFTGGVGTNGPLNSAELLDMGTGKSTQYLMTYPRAFHAAAGFAGGGVMVAGGSGAGAGAEFFQSTGFSLSNNISFEGSFPSAVPVPATGEVVLNGGFDAGWTPIARLVIVDPVKNAVDGYTGMSLPRALFSDVPLGDGTVLIAGGVTTSAFTATASADVFDPASKSFTAHPVMTQARAGYASQPLRDGTALLIGGFSSIDPVTGKVILLNTAEIYNP